MFKYRIEPPGPAAVFSVYRLQLTCTLMASFHASQLTAHKQPSGGFALPHTGLVCLPCQHALPLLSLQSLPSRLINLRLGKVLSASFRSEASRHGLASHFAHV